MSRLISLKTYALRPASVNLIFPQNFSLRKVGTRLYSIGAWRLRKNWPNSPGSNEQEHLRGCRQALHRSGLPVRESLIWAGSFDRDEVARICHKGLFKPTGRPSALFATNGVTGLEALRSIYAAGLETPRDIAFVSFDELTTDDFFHPSITCVLQPTFDIGYRAVEVLLNRIEKGKAEGRPAKIRLPATLVVRESSESARP